MRRLLFILLPAVLIPACTASPTVRGIGALRHAPLYTFNEWELDAYLRWLARQDLPTSSRAVLFARQNVGQPYRLGLLGEFPFELYDSDPAYCLSASDCLTFVEQTYAMALSRDWASFFRVLQRVRYQHGRIGILTRNHFMESDWNVNNSWLFDDITDSLGGVKAAAMRVRVDRSALLRRYHVDVDLPVEIVEDFFLPRESLPAVLVRLQDGDIAEFVRGDGQWQWVSHVGLLAHDAAGSVTLLHATEPAVREQRLEDYVREHPPIVGFKFLRLAEGNDDGEEEWPEDDRQVVRLAARLFGVH